MMKRTTMMALLLVAGGATAAQAQRTTANPYRYWDVCGGTVSTFSTCAAVDIELIAPGRMQLRVWNLSGNPDRYGTATPTNTVFTGIGFFNMGQVTASATSLQMSGPEHLNSLGESPTQWRIVNDDATPENGDSDNLYTPMGVRIEMGTATESGQFNADDGIVRDCPPVEQFANGDFSYWANPCNALPDWSSNAGWVVFEFDFTGSWGDVATTELVLYGRSAADNTISTECVTGGKKENCYDTNVVPEPITMTLMGTGLLGIGLARRRRRKNGDIVDA